MLAQAIAYGQNVEATIYFSSGQAKLNQKALANLDAVLLKCENYPDFTIDIKAYADDRGSAKANQKLSNRRASEVFKLLKEKGLNPTKEIIDAKGEIALINRTNTELEREKNRRVDILIRAFAPKNWEEYYSFFKKRNTQNFYVQNGRDTTIVGKKGTVLFIPKNSFELSDGSSLGNVLVKIDMYEAYTYKDMLVQNLTTVSDEKLLETGGMIHLDAKRIEDGASVSIRPNQKLRLTMPSADELPEGMQLFTANRAFDSSSNAINWTTDGTKFSEPDLLKTIETSLGYFSELITTKNNAPNDLGLPEVQLDFVINVPSKPSIRPMPIQNFKKPTLVVDFETFKSKLSRKVATKTRNKESRGKYKKRLIKSYKLTKLYYRRDSMKFIKDMKQYNNEVAAHIEDSLSYEEKFNFYMVKKDVHQAECTKIRTWMQNNRRSIERWANSANDLSKLAVQGKTVKKYFGHIGQLLNAKELMKQEAQRAGLFSLIDTLDEIQMDLRNVKRAAIKLHLAVKALDVKIPRTHEMVNRLGSKVRRFLFENDFSRISDLEHDDLAKVYTFFTKANQFVPNLEDLVARFDNFASDSALISVIGYLKELDGLNERFKQENVLRRRSHFVKVWESQWYDTMKDSEKDDYDKKNIEEKEAFADYYVLKQTQSARIARLEVLEGDYYEFFTAVEKENYLTFKVIEKERFLNRFIKTQFGKVENVVGISSLGWINCDAFIRGQLLAVSIPTTQLASKSVKYYMCLKNRRSVLPMYNSTSTPESLLVGKIPEGSMVQIVGIRLQGGTVELSSTEGKIEDLNNKPLAEFKAVRMDEIASILN
jgi:hypothetical protein